MLKIYYKKAKDEDIQQLNEVRDGCWIHVDEATTTDLEELARLTKIEYADLLDCLDKYEIPRIERSDHNLLIFTRYPTDQEVGLYTSTLTLILANHYFITVSPHRSLLVKNFLSQKNKFSTLQSTKLLILILMKINQEFTGQIRRVRYNVLSAEKEMVHVESDDITTLTKNEEVLNQYLSSLVPTRSVLEGIHSGRFTSLYEKEQVLIEDCLNSIRQSEELCGIVLKSIRSLRDAYQIIFANNLHKTIKLLTSLTIILSIPTMIASVYGMNVNLPLAKNTFAFGIVMTFTAILSVFGLWIFRKKGWL
ncbi:MAG: magnesium transporter CorA family protein [Simkaniaceae bacterium]|nr:magnesium transporter CorA family protein [Candidatus Sacchlamyda saccharinae]